MAKQRGPNTFQKSLQKKKKIQNQIEELKKIKASLDKSGVKIKKLGVKPGDTINASSVRANNNFLKTYDSKLKSLQDKLKSFNPKAVVKVITKDAPKLSTKRKLSSDESKISKATMMGGTPFGMSVDEKKKAKKYDPTKANRAGQRMGQRKEGGLTKINPQKQPGLAALKKKAPGVVAKMGYAKKGTMVQARGCGVARKKPTKLS